MNLFKKISVKAKAKSGEKLSPEDVKILLECGSDELVRHYLRMYSLPESAHLALLDRNNELIALYVAYPTHNFSEEAERVLFANKSKNLIKHYLNYNKPSRPMQKELLSRGDEDLLKEFVENYAFDNEEDEITFVTQASDELVLEYVKRRELSDEAFKALLETRKSALAATLACQIGLDDECEELFMQKATADEIWQYAESCEGLSYEAELILVKNGNVDLIEKYIQHWRLGYSDCDENPAEMELLKLGNKDLLMTYVTWHEPCEKFVCELIKDGDKDIVMKLVSGHTLSCDAENLLFDRGVEFVKCYISHCSLGSPRAEEKLVENCPTDMVKNYIKEYGAGRNLQEFLIRRGDVELVKFCIDQNDFAVSAQILLAKTLNKDLITYYDQKRNFEDKIWKVITQSFFLKNL